MDEDVIIYYRSVNPWILILIDSDTDTLVLLVLIKSLSYDHFRGDGGKWKIPSTFARKDARPTNKSSSESLGIIARVGYWTTRSFVHARCVRDKQKAKILASEM